MPEDDVQQQAEDPPDGDVEGQAKESPDDSDVSDDKDTEAPSAKARGSAYIALGLGIVFMVVGLLLAISALPTETKRGILVIGSLFPGDVVSGQGDAQDTLFFLGFAILALGAGLILAEGFAQRYTITYLGVSLSGTLAIVGLAFIGWKTIAQPPVFRYATVRFVCPDSTPPDGDVRVRVHTGTLLQDQREDMLAGLLELEQERYDPETTELAELGAAEGSKIRTQGRLDFYLPLPEGSDTLFLPTLLDIRHEVTFEHKPPIRPGSDGSAPIAATGADLQPVGGYQRFMRIDVTPQAIPGSRGWSLEWPPQLLEATIFVGKIEHVCPQPLPQGTMEVNLDN